MDPITREAWVPLDPRADGLRVTLHGQSLAGRPLAIHVDVQAEGGWVSAVNIAVDGQMTPLPVSPPANPPPEARKSRLVALLGENASEPALRGRWLVRPSQSMIGTGPAEYRELDRIVASQRAATLQWLIEAIALGANLPHLHSEVYGLLARADHVAAWLNTKLGVWLRKEAGIDAQILIDRPKRLDLRLGWALAVCESREPPRKIDMMCWHRFALTDIEAATALQNEIDELDVTFAELAPEHPIQIRLRRLRAAHKIE